MQCSLVDDSMAAATCLSCIKGAGHTCHITGRDTDTQPANCLHPSAYCSHSSMGAIHPYMSTSSIITQTELSAQANSSALPIVEPIPYHDTQALVQRLQNVMVHSKII